MKKFFLVSIIPQLSSYYLIHRRINLFISKYPCTRVQWPRLLSVNLTLIFEVFPHSYDDYIHKTHETVSRKNNFKKFPQAKLTIDTEILLTMASKLKLLATNSEMPMHTSLFSTSYIVCNIWTKLRLVLRP